MNQTMSLSIKDLACIILDQPPEDDEDKYQINSCIDNTVLIYVIIIRTSQLLAV